MKNFCKVYYLKNGRLDLSALEENNKVRNIRPLAEEEKNNAEPKIYMDDKISSILEEMGGYFTEQENNS